MRRMELDAGIKNIMVIVPHEDDEILLAAGIMEKALAKGIGVHVVMAGNGDYEGHDEATGIVFCLFGKAIGTSCFPCLRFLCLGVPLWGSFPGFSVSAGR